MSNSGNKQKVLTALKNKNFVKVISGIKNYDKQKTISISLAAESGGASALDICDDPEIIKAVKASVELPIFVSSIDPLKLIAAQSLGADVLEVGNYESFYAEGEMFTPSAILEILQFVRKSVPKDIIISVTVPATLEMENQLSLAKDLAIAGADIIQTEGFAPEIPDTERKDQSYLDILKAASTLTNTIELRKILPNANIITASGITPTTAPLAISMGANGVGVGNYINSLQTQAEMTKRVKEVVGSVNSFAPQYLEYIKTPAIKV